jgi:hypothetical protein
MGMKTCCKLKVKVKREKKKLYFVRNSSVQSGINHWSFGEREELAVCFLLGLPFHSEDGANTFLQNLSWFSSGYKKLYSWIQNSS